jgi:hypothetical protein
MDCAAIPNLMPLQLAGEHLWAYLAMAEHGCVSDVEVLLRAVHVLVVL